MTTNKVRCTSCKRLHYGALPVCDDCQTEMSLAHKPRFEIRSLDTGHICTADNPTVAENVVQDAEYCVYAYDNRTGAYYVHTRKHGCRWCRNKRAYVGGAEN